MHLRTAFFEPCHGLQQPSKRMSATLQHSSRTDSSASETSHLKSVWCLQLHLKLDLSFANIYR